MEEWFFLLQSNIVDLDYEKQEFLYRSFHRFVYKDIYFLVRDHELSEDIIQESFMKVVKSGPKAIHESNMKSWIKKVARNTTIDWLRKNKKNRYIIHTDFVSSLDLGELSTFNETSVAYEVEEKQRNELLHQAINELKPSYRTLLFLYYMEEKSYMEICEELQLTEQVVTQRLARARKKLLKHFLKKWGDQDG